MAWTLLFNLQVLISTPCTCDALQAPRCTAALGGAASFLSLWWLSEAWPGLPGRFREAVLRRRHPVYRPGRGGGGLALI